MIRLRHDVSAFPETWHLGPSKHSLAGRQRGGGAAGRLSPPSSAAWGWGSPRLGERRRGRGGHPPGTFPGAWLPHPRGRARGADALTWGPGWGGGSWPGTGAPRGPVFWVSSARPGSAGGQDAPGRCYRAPGCAPSAIEAGTLSSPPGKGGGGHEERGGGGHEE